MRPLYCVSSANTSDLDRDNSHDIEIEDSSDASVKNNSLSCISSVIKCLVAREARKTRLIPFRDPKLTLIFRDTFGGNPKACVVATVSPSAKAEQEAKLIRNEADPNKDTCEIVAALQAEMAELRSQLEKYRSQNHNPQMKRNKSTVLKSLTDQTFGVQGRVPNPEKHVSEEDRKRKVREEAIDRKFKERRLTNQRTTNEVSEWTVEEVKGVEIQLENSGEETAMLEEKIRELDATIERLCDEKVMSKERIADFTYSSSDVNDETSICNFDTKAQVKNITDMDIDDNLSSSITARSNSLNYYSQTDANSVGVEDEDKILSDEVSDSQRQLRKSLEIVSTDQRVVSNQIDNVKEKLKKIAQRRKERVEITSGSNSLNSNQQTNSNSIGVEEDEDKILNDLVSDSQGQLRKSLEMVSTDQKVVSNQIDNVKEKIKKIAQRRNERVLGNRSNIAEREKSSINIESEMKSLQDKVQPEINQNKTGISAKDQAEGLQCNLQCRNFTANEHKNNLSESKQSTFQLTEVKQTLDEIVKEKSKHFLELETLIEAIKREQQQTIDDLRNKLNESRRVIAEQESKQPGFKNQLFAIQGINEDLCSEMNKISSQIHVQKSMVCSFYNKIKLLEGDKNKIIQRLTYENEENVKMSTKEVEYLQEEMEKTSEEKSILKSELCTSEAETEVLKSNTINSTAQSDQTAYLENKISLQGKEMNDMKRKPVALNEGKLKSLIKTDGDLTEIGDSPRSVINETQTEYNLYSGGKMNRKCKEGGYGLGARRPLIHATPVTSKTVFAKNMHEKKTICQQEETQINISQNDDHMSIDLPDICLVESLGKKQSKKDVETDNSDSEMNLKIQMLESKLEVLHDEKSNLEVELREKTLLLQSTNKALIDKSKAFSELCKEKMSFRSEKDRKTWSVVKEEEKESISSKKDRTKILHEPPPSKRFRCETVQDDEDMNSPAMAFPEVKSKEFQMEYSRFSAQVEKLEKVCTSEEHIPSNLTSLISAPISEDSSPLANIDNATKDIPADQTMKLYRRFLEEQNKELKHEMEEMEKSYSYFESIPSLLPNTNIVSPPIHQDCSTDFNDLSINLDNTFEKMSVDQSIELNQTFDTIFSSLNTEFDEINCNKLNDNRSKNFKNSNEETFSHEKSPTNIGRGTSMNSGIILKSQSTPSKKANHRQVELVHSDDKHLLTDYSLELIKQLRLCHFTESDRKSRGGKRENIAIGYGGLQCVHCCDNPKSRKYFWSKVECLANSFAKIGNHILNCPQCPDETKTMLRILKACHHEQMSKLERGSQKIFFNRMWRRMHNQDATKEEATPNASEAFGASKKSGSKEVKYFDEVKMRKTGAIETAGKSSISPKYHELKPHDLIRSSGKESTKSNSTKDIAASISTKHSEQGAFAFEEDQKLISDLDCFVKENSAFFCASDQDANFTQSDKIYRASGCDDYEQTFPWDGFNFNG